MAGVAVEMSQESRRIRSSDSENYNMSDMRHRWTAPARMKMTWHYLIIKLKYFLLVTGFNSPKKIAPATFRVIIVQPLNSKLLIAPRFWLSIFFRQWWSLSLIICWGWFNWKSSFLCDSISLPVSSCHSSRFSQVARIVWIVESLHHHSALGTLNRIILFH